MKRLTNAIVLVAAALAMTVAMRPASVMADEPETTDVQADTVFVGDTGDAASLASNLDDSSIGKTYAHSDTATQGSITLTVQWDEPVLGQPTTFHVSATGGSGSYKYYMAAPMYSSPNEYSYQSVADPSRTQYWHYTEDVCESYDYSFTMMATGTYYINFYVMDTGVSSNVTLRTNTFIKVSDASYPSVASIVNDAVARAKSATDGSEYEMALWLHDWLLDQLEYDNTLKWSGAEAALTRHTGTCQAYTNAYIKLLDAAGIENAETRDTYDGHTWNAVKMDGEWYQVDCTWDDNDDTKCYGFDSRHLYFGLTDELMAVAHKGHANIYTAEGYKTRSTSLTDNYYVKSGLASQWADAYAARIQVQLDAKETSFSLRSDNANNPPSIIGIQNAVVAYAVGQKEWFASDGEKADLTAVSNVTTVSNTEWTAVYDFTAEYLQDVSVCKPSTDSSSWTHPTKDGYAFAGWYTDETCSTAYIGSTGYAYACFVPVSELITFKGGSLRMDLTGSGDYTKTSLRFGYEMKVPDGATLDRSNWGWNWKNPANGKTGFRTADVYWMNDDNGAIANLLITPVYATGHAAGYTTNYEVTAQVAYVTADGTGVTACDKTRTRSVDQVATAIKSNQFASDAEKAYAEGILAN